MRSLVCIALLLLLAGSATAQLPSLRRRIASPSPSPVPSPSPKPSPALAEANETAAANATMEEMPAEDDTATTPAAGAAAPKRAANTTATLKGNYASPADAAAKIPELKELNSLIAASPAISKLLADKDLVATIFAPNNDAIKAALKYVSANFPNLTTSELADVGILDALLQYHVSGKSAVSSDKLKNGQKLTMLNGETTTIITKDMSEPTGGARHLLQGDSVLAFIRSNTNQTIPIQDADYKAGKSIVHIIDGVLIPDSLAQNYSMTDIPGASNETLEEAPTADNETAADTNETTANATAAGAPAPAAASAPKSAAGMAVATLLALPALLVLML